MKRLVALALSFALAISPALASHSVCQTETIAKIYAQQISDEHAGAGVTIINKEQTLAMVRHINQVTNANSQNALDEKDFIGAIVVELPSLNAVVFAWIHADEDVCAWITIPLRHWRAMIRDSSGEPV